MRNLGYALALGLAFVAGQFTPAAAQSRIFVSGGGSDANNNVCTLAAPCRSFQHAHDVAAAGSEIAVLDTAGYGPVHITKSISIVNPGGVEAGISPSYGNDAIIVDAGSSGVVNLKGLTLDGLGIGRTGITVVTGAKVSIEDSVVRHFTLDGIYFSVPAAGYLFVTDTLVLDNGRNGVYALSQSAQTSANVKATLTRVQALNNVTGFAAEVDNAYAYIPMAIIDSTAAHNVTGIAATGAVNIVVQNVAITDNDTGLLTADWGQRLSVINLSKSLIRESLADDGTTNQYGWKISNNGLIFSTGDNLVYSIWNTGSLSASSSSYQ